jgi:hypothetical protein
MAKSKGATCMSCNESIWSGDHTKCKELIDSYFAQFDEPRGRTVTPQPIPTDQMVAYWEEHFKPQVKELRQQVASLTLALTTAKAEALEQAITELAKLNIPGHSVVEPVIRGAIEAICKLKEGKSE